MNDLIVLGHMSNRTYFTYYNKQIINIIHLLISRHFINNSCL